MGREKDRIIEEEDRWKETARREGYRCVMCSSVIPKDEYEGGDGMTCSYCAHVMAKDD